MALYLGSNEVSQKVLLLGGNKSDIEVGDLCYSLRPEKEGWLLCDGTSYSTTDYPNLFAVIGYTFGGSENNFRVPNYKGKFLQMINDNQTIGQNVEAGLPNIEGTFGRTGGALSAYNSFTSTGVFTSDLRSQYGVNNTGVNTEQMQYGVSFDASRSSSIYGNSNTVQPPASIVNYFIKY